METSIDGRPQYLGNDWLASLEPRKREEASFHDTDRTGHRNEIEKEAGNAHWYRAAQPVGDYVRSWIAENAPGKDILDYASGSGPMSRDFAKAGARSVLGIDISEVSVRNAVENTRDLGNVRFLQRDCEDTGLPADSFDIVLCSGMLHHLDLTRAFPEIARVLRRGGRAFCIEALAHNPAIKLYRRLTPQHRTAWETEHILSTRDLRYARQWFRVSNVRYFCPVSPLATLIPPGKARDIALNLGHMADDVITRIPLVRLWSWQFIFELVKY